MLRRLEEYFVSHATHFYVQVIYFPVTQLNRHTFLIFQ